MYINNTNLWFHVCFTISWGFTILFRKLERSPTNKLKDALSPFHHCGSLFHKTLKSPSCCTALNLWRLIGSIINMPLGTVSSLVQYPAVLYVVLCELCLIYNVTMSQWNEWEWNRLLAGGDCQKCNTLCMWMTLPSQFTQRQGCSDTAGVY